MNDDTGSIASETASGQARLLYENLIQKPRFDAVKSLYWSYLTRVDYAYAVIMCEQGLLSDNEVKLILKAMRRLEQEIDNSLAGGAPFPFSGQDYILDSRKYLYSLLPPGVGEKLYQYRNHDELLHAVLRMALKDRLFVLAGILLSNLDGILVNIKRNRGIGIPVSADMRSPIPVSWESYLLAHAELMLRDCKRFMDCLEQIDVSPFGAGDGISEGIQLNRKRLSELLGFRSFQDSTLSPLMMNDGYRAVFETLRQLFANVALVTEELTRRIDASVIHIQTGNCLDMLQDALGEIHMLALLAANTASSFSQITQYPQTACAGNTQFSLHIYGYRVFDSGVKAMRLIDAIFRSVKGTEVAFLEKLDREGQALSQLTAYLIRNERLSHDMVSAIVTKLGDKMTVQGITASQITFNDFQALFHQQTQKLPEMPEEKFLQLLSPYSYLSAHGISASGSVLQEPLIARYEKKSFDLRAHLDSYTRRIEQADQMLARAVDSLII